MSHQIRIKIDAVTVMSSLYPYLPITFDETWNIGVGTGNDAADTAVRLSYTLATTVTQDIDLTAITGPNGETISFAEVHAIYVSSTGAGGLKPHAVNGWEGFGSGADIAFGVSGALLWMVGTGYAVDSTHKVLTLTNAGAATATYNIIIIGRD
jgi:hypothetical protein